MIKPFLTAEWRNLIMANYIIDPDVLKPFLPAKTELDFYQGHTYVSLVGFLFANTRVKGVKIPFHVNFEEVNLRFYVKHLDRGVWKRGVVFISEIVPKPAITIIANTIYKEHYIYRPMKHAVQQSDNTMQVVYYWKNKGKWNNIRVTASSGLVPLAEGSVEEFIAEHYWGYSAHKKRTVEYGVHHPQWEMYPLKKYSIDCDFEAQYGEGFAFLQDRQPDSIFLVKGSGVEVSGKRNL